MVTRGTGILRRQGNGYAVEMPEAAIPPGYTLEIGLPLPGDAVDGMRLDYVITPAAGLRARWLRWRYPAKSTP